MEKTFIKYREALEILEAHRTTFPITEVPIHDANGLFLAEPLVADRDIPPYDRVTMDGIALRFSSFAKGIREFPIEATAPAGTPQRTLSDPDNCIEVMTGAMLPKGTDTVVRYEDLSIENRIAALTVDTITEQQNVHFKGMDTLKGIIVKEAGQRISSAEINVAAATGKDNLSVYKMPRSAIISTGDELVDVHETPLPHQIRRSNVYGIKNTLESWGISSELKHLPDDMTRMEQIIEALLREFDLLVITGGVSKGTFDYLPDVLSKLGVVKHFHKIQQRPGKPFWFGTAKNGNRVFALPGNPVSSFVCLYAYIRFWLLRSLNIREEPLYVKLAEEVHFNRDLVLFTEAKLKSGADGVLYAYPVLGNGSGDFINLVHTDGFLVLPQERSIFKKGEVYPFLRYRNNW